MTNLKILMLNQEFPPIGGGASPITFELCKQLVEMGNEVDVVTMHYGKLPRFEVIEGVNIYRTACIRKSPSICHPHELATFIVGAFPMTLSLARKRKYDIIHCHFLVPSAPMAWLLSKLTSIPFIVTCHGSDVPGHNPDRFGLMHKMIHPAWRFFAKRTRLIVSPSQSLKEKILLNCPQAKVEVIPNGIYPEKFSPTEKTKSILMCSRIFSFKGFQYAIEAAKELESDWEINIIGHGPFLPELKKIAEGSKMPIKFLGWLDKTDDNFLKLFNNSSIFIFTSEAENFPSVLLEAMSAKMAIITSTAGGCPEVVGDAAILVPPRDSEAIKMNLVKLMNSEKLRNDLAEAAYERVQQFSWENITTRYLSRYKDVIDKNSVSQK